MITEKDLEIEYRRDTGVDRSTNYGWQSSEITSFNQWVIEKYLGLRNKIVKIKDHGSSS